jgi:hypothetical protein
VIFTIIGALFKIQHWPYGSEILTIGSLLEVSGIVFIMVILFKYFLKKIRSNYTRLVKKKLQFFKIKKL